MQFPRYRIDCRRRRLHTLARNRHVMYHYPMLCGQNIAHHEKVNPLPTGSKPVPPPPKEFSFWQRFRRVPARERRLAAEAAFAVLAANAVLRLLPARAVLGPVGAVGSGASPDQTPSGDQAALADDLARAVGRAGRCLPLPSTCLMQAIALKWMMRRRGLACSLVLGVGKRPRLSAHAWIEFDHRIILGGSEARKFRPIARTVPFSLNTPTS